MMSNYGYKKKSVPVIFETPCILNIIVHLVGFICEDNFLKSKAVFDCILHILVILSTHRDVSPESRRDYSYLMEIRQICSKIIVLKKFCSS